MRTICSRSAGLPPESTTASSMSSSTPSASAHGAGAGPETLDLIDEPLVNLPDEALRPSPGVLASILETI